MKSNVFALLSGIVVATTIALTAQAYAEVGSNRPASTASAIHMAAITPLSFRYFCAGNKSECVDGGSSDVEMTSDLMGLLEQVNVHVNRSIRPAADTADIWELNPSSGDCEDYVLSKRSMLIRQGVASGSLRIAYTHTPRGEAHAILVVRSRSGDYVLDNLSNKVKTLRASGYTIRSMSSGNPTKWSAS